MSTTLIQTAFLQVFFKYSTLCVSQFQIHQKPSKKAIKGLSCDYYCQFLSAYLFYLYSPEVWVLLQTKQLDSFWVSTTFVQSKSLCALNSFFLFMPIRLYLASLTNQILLSPLVAIHWADLTSTFQDANVITFGSTPLHPCLFLIIWMFVWAWLIHTFIQRMFTECLVSVRILRHLGRNNKAQPNRMLDTQALSKCLLSE